MTAGLALGQAAIGVARLIGVEASNGTGAKIANHGKRDHVPRNSRPHRENRRRGEQAGDVDVGGVRRQVNIACIVDEEHPVASCVGDWVLIHVGFAMSRIDEAEAAETLRILTELGEAQAELEAMRLSGAE